MCSMIKNHFAEQISEPEETVDYEPSEPLDYLEKQEEFKKDLDPESYCVTKGCLSPRAMMNTGLCCDCSMEKSNEEIRMKKVMC